jgi:CheY-like chemotaxis protein
MPAPETPCVLVVDDDSALRLTIAAILDAAGYPVQLAANGQEALAQVQEQRPALVLLDLQMPEMSGQDALAELRRLACPVPVVMMSAGLPVAEEAAAHRADGYLEKPFAIEQLLAVVDRFCNDGPSRRC